MKTFYGKDKACDIKGLTGVGLGNFDGLHVGHMALINTLISESRMNGISSLLYTFTKHPENILRKKLFNLQLTTVNKKIQLLNDTSLDYLYFDEFDEHYSRTSPESFVKEVLVGRLHARLVVAGFDYRFGFKGEGDISALKSFGARYNIKVIVIPPIKIDNTVVSSTLIRQNVIKGDMEEVFKFLGRHYSVTGKVQNGRKVGSKIGFPTANLHPEDYLILPKKGVYITRTLMDGEFFPSITNVGINPTFDDCSSIQVETHIINFNGDIYNKDIEVFFLSKIRDERKFAGKSELITQIKSDVATAKNYFFIS